jgi:RNA polymerase sigma-70 factor, ECF subfamily
VGAGSFGERGVAVSPRESDRVRAGEIDPHITAAARRGDRAAFAAILRHYDAGLRSLASRLMGNRDDMDDAMQEAAIKAYRSLPQFRGESAVGTWLYRTTYTACIDQLRRRRTLEPLTPVLLEQRFSAGDDPAEIVDKREQLTALLGGLPDEQKAAVVLVDAQGLDYKSAAFILGLPVGTLASRLAAGRAALRATCGPPLVREEES